MRSDGGTLSRFSATRLSFRRAKLEEIRRSAAPSTVATVPQQFYGLCLVRDMTFLNPKLSGLRS
jgi:hypothetical protein